MQIPFSTFDPIVLRNFVSRVFKQIGHNEQLADQAADVLIKADLRGIDSHGVARLSGYVRLWQKKRINAQPKLQIVHETPSTATLDGDAGLGLIVAPEAMRMAIQKAKEVGTGWVAVRNSNHFGIAAYHALLAAQEDMIGFSVTNASPLVAPTHSKERMLGTNPICYAFPAGQFPPMVIDMATSAAANGKLEIAQRTHKPIPHGWAQDRDGLSSTDPHVLKTQGGMLLPLGSDLHTGSHKGFGLASIVDVLSGVLSGANYGPWVPPFVAFLDPLTNLPGLGLGHFVGAMRVDAFRPVSEFKQHMDQWITRFKESIPVDPAQPVIIPGEPEFAEEIRRTTDGIPLVSEVVADLERLAEEMGIPPLQAIK
jgi:LDH2 family malate/lactate/ureidoglycolate dehydrogenase